MFGFHRRRRRRLRAEPTPAGWLEVLARNVPYFGLLDEPERNQLLADMRVFLAEKELEGCGGLEITDEIRISIAAQACILLLGRETDCYPSLRLILVAHRTLFRSPLPELVPRIDSQDRTAWRPDATPFAHDDVIARATDPGGPSGPGLSSVRAPVGARPGGATPMVSRGSRSGRARPRSPTRSE